MQIKSTTSVLSEHKHGNSNIFFAREQIYITKKAFKALHYAVITSSGYFITREKCRINSP